MKAKKHQQNTSDLFRAHLEQILDQKHPLFKLSNQIDWEYFEVEFGSFYVENRGRPGKPIRLLVGLHYLKHTYNESDESVIDRFLENPYWQYFCGFDYFQHEMPLDPTLLVKWRHRVGVSGIEKLLAGTIMTAKSMKVLTKSHMRKVNVDTTVQEKAVAFPTDARLYYKMREKLVKAAQERGIKLRQNYRRLAKKALAKQGRYAHAKQMKRARKETKQLKTFMGRVTRDIQRKAKYPDQVLKDLLQLSERLFNQKKNDKKKLYSIHAPEVECISKGKAHKRYEFGNKSSIATTSRDNWIIGMQAHHGNPYDGHTLQSVIDQIKRLTIWEAKEYFCDRGYRGHNYEGPAKVHIVGTRRKKLLSRSMKKWMKRRSAVEPKIGHLKSDNRLGRNYYKGIQGDHLNTLLAGCGANLRKLIAFFLSFFKITDILGKFFQLSKFLWSLRKNSFMGLINHSL